MAVRSIVRYPNPILSQGTARVDPTKEESLVRDLIDTMRRHHGAGLAAPQIGVAKRVCVIARDRRDQALVNPEIVWKSEEKATAVEGCLSGLSASVTRPIAVRVRYLDISGKSKEELFEGFTARCAQHEIDHLDGVTIVDR